MIEIEKSETASAEGCQTEFPQEKFVSKWMKSNVNGHLCMTRVNGQVVEGREFSFFERFLLGVGLL